MSLLYDDKIYTEGSNLHSEMMKVLSSINQNFEEYKKNADATESKVAAIDYDGVYLGIINQIDNSISMLREKLEFVKTIAEEAKEIISSYNNDESSTFSIEARIFGLALAYNNKFNSQYREGDALSSTLNYENIYKDGFVPQGITVVGNQVFITAYSKNEENSRIYVYEDGKCQYRVALDTDAHVGGVTYDEKNKVLLVTGSKGAINAYSVDVMKMLANDLNKNKNDNSSSPIIDLTNTRNSTAILNSNINMNYEQLSSGYTTTGYNSASVYYDNETGKVYIARFSNDGKMITGDAIYNPTTGTYNLENPKTVNIDNGVQGINIYHRDGKTYLVESRSFGTQDGEITVRDITDGIENSKVIGSKTIHNYSEGTFTGSDGNSTIVFETGKAGLEDKKYNHQTDTININKIIDEANGESWDIKNIDATYDKGDASASENGYNTHNI